MRAWRVQTNVNDREMKKVPVNCAVLCHTFCSFSAAFIASAVFLCSCCFLAVNNQRTTNPQEMTGLVLWLTLPADTPQPPPPQPTHRRKCVAWVTVFAVVMSFYLATAGGMGFRWGWGVVLFFGVVICRTLWSQCFLRLNHVSGLPQRKTTQLILMSFCRKGM